MFDARQRLVQEFDRAGQLPRIRSSLAEQEDEVGVGEAGYVVHRVGHPLGDRDAVVDAAGQPARAGEDAAEPESQWCDVWKDVEARSSALSATAVSSSPRPSAPSDITNANDAIIA